MTQIIKIPMVHIIIQVIILKMGMEMGMVMFMVTRIQDITSQITTREVRVLLNISNTIIQALMKIVIPKNNDIYRNCTYCV